MSGFLLLCLRSVTQLSLCTARLNVNVAYFDGNTSASNCS